MVSKPEWIGRNSKHKCYLERVPRNRTISKADEPTDFSDFEGGNSTNVQMSETPFLGH